VFFPGKSQLLTYSCTTFDVFSRQEESTNLPLMRKHLVFFFFPTMQESTTLEKKEVVYLFFGGKNQTILMKNIGCYFWIRLNYTYHVYFLFSFKNKNHLDKKQILMVLLRVGKKINYVPLNVKHLVLFLDKNHLGTYLP